MVVGLVLVTINRMTNAVLFYLYAVMYYYNYNADPLGEQIAGLVHL